MTNHSGSTSGFRRGAVRVFLHSAGVMILFVATALFLANLATPADLSPINDPILHLPLTRVFWMAGVLGTLVGMICLLARKTRLPASVVAAFALAFLACRVLVSAFDLSEGFGGYLGGVGDLFGLSGRSADTLLLAMNVYLLAGGVVSFYVDQKLKTPGGGARGVPR